MAQDKRITEPQGHYIAVRQEMALDKARKAMAARKKQEDEGEAWCSRLV
jgi:hypothetical protein